jgi:hypothetical protein
VTIRSFDLRAVAHQDCAHLLLSVIAQRDRGIESCRAASRQIGNHAGDRCGVKGTRWIRRETATRSASPESAPIRQTIGGSRERRRESLPRAQSTSISVDRLPRTPPEIALLLERLTLIVTF